MKAIDNDTTNQTSIELQETSHGEQKNSDTKSCSTDDTNKTEIDIDTRPHVEKIYIEQTTLAEEKKEPTPASDVDVNDTIVENETWRKSDPVSFPVSKKYQTCCNSCLRLCFHSLVDVDDLILRQERQNIHLLMQEGEEIETSCDKKLEHVMDCSMGICCKKPKSCCSHGESCWKHPVMVWGYRGWQFMFVLIGAFLFVRADIGSLLCDDSTFFNSTTGQNFRCPAVQEQLRNSNYTNGYAGMIKTMKALEESNLEFIPGMTFSEYFNTSNIDSETGYPERYENFLQWHALTSSPIPWLLVLVYIFCLMIVMPVSMFLVFGMQFQKDDPTEIMFPPLLETKDTDEEENMFPPLLETKDTDEENVEEVDMELGIEKTLQSFHFVRPKKLVLQSSLWGSMVMFVFWFFVIPFAPFVVLMGMSLGPVVSILLVGLFVQIHNATTLANILVQLYSIGKLSSEQQQAQFEQWKHFYKTTVGALHIWSWRMTPIIGSLLLVLGSSLLGDLVQSIFLYTSIISEPDIPESDRMEIFRKVSSSTLQYVVLVTIVLLIITSAIAMVSVRYKRLHLLVATLRLPKHRLEDFEIIQKCNAAVTIFDVPITAKTVIALLRLLFIQTVLVALASAGS